MTDTNRTRERFLDFRHRLYERHDLGAVDAHLHPEFDSHSANVQPRLAAYRAARRAEGAASIDVRPAYKGFVEALHVGLPDLRPVEQQVVVEGERLVAMSRWTATHTGPFLGIPATGKAVHFATADLYRLRDGLLFEHWDVADLLDAWITLGVVRRAEAAGPGRQG